MNSNATDAHIRQTGARFTPNIKRGEELACARATTRGARQCQSIAAADGADIICQMAADLSHDPQYLPQMIEATDQYDVVIGSRYAPGAGLVNWPRYRAILSRGANAYVRLVTGLPVRDCTSGYRCWRRSAVQQIRWQHIGSEGLAFLVETLCEAAELKCRVGESPIVFTGRRLGASKLTGRIFRESLVVPWRILLRVRSRRSTRSSP